MLPGLPFWLRKGRAGFKQRVSELARLDVSLLPYNEAVTDYVLAQKETGREVILATAADRSIAEQVAAHTALFDGVLSSDGTVNLSGTRKLQAIRERVNGGAFEYIADARPDLPIWKESARAVMVNAGGKAQRQVKENGTPVMTLDDKTRPTMRNFFKAMRVHQWVKNLLLFLPLLLAHHVTDVEKLSTLALEFAAFCLCASAVYITNDLADLQADRRHPYKRHRPFAAGTLPLWVGMVGAPILFTASIALTLLLPFAFAVVLAIYVVLTTAYSFRLKRVAMLDVIILAALYTVRIYAGAVGIDVRLSPWFLGFSTFIFLSLAFAKRYSELYRLKQENRQMAAGRDYETPDIEMLAVFGIVSGYLSVLVFALYLNSSDVTLLYTQPGLLWFICPALIYWISRLWLLAHRGQLHEDPVIFALTDPISYLTVAVSGALILLAV
jgi:4-hydroxybenzoate polyprenyltransferase